MDIPAPKKKDGWIKKGVVVFYILLLAGIAAGVSCGDFKKAKAADKAWEQNLEKYVHVEKAGLFRGQWAYIVTDKAGNKHFVSDNITFPVKD